MYMYVSYVNEIDTENEINTSIHFLALSWIVPPIEEPLPIGLPDPQRSELEESLLWT